MRKDKPTGRRHLLPKFREIINEGSVENERPIQFSGHVFDFFAFLFRAKQRRDILRILK